MTQPLRSTDITPLQRYYELLRPGVAHRYARSRGATHLSFSLNIATTGSHVPQKSLKQRHATFTPAHPANQQAAAGLLPSHTIRPGFDVTRFFFRRLISGSLALVSLFLT